MQRNDELISFKSDLRRCTTHIRKTKSLIISLYVNLIYIIFTILCFFLVPLILPLEKTLIANDFRIFYQSAQTILDDPSKLYSLPNYNMPFRYFPMFSIFFIPYTYIPFEVGFVLHTILLGIFQIFSFYLIYILSTYFYDVEYNLKIKRDLLYIALMAPLQVPMILMGQISHIFIFLILIVILLIENMRKKRYKIRFDTLLLGVIFGLSISFKPFAILIIPLLLKLIINIKEQKFKINSSLLLKIIVGLIFSNIINIIFFLSFPGLIKEFLNINSTTQIINYPSSSITRIISVIFNLFSLEPLIMLILTIILYGFMYSVYLIIPRSKLNYPAFFGMVLLIVMINFTDSWFLNFLIFFMIIFPGLFKFEDEINEISSENLLKKLRFSNFVIYKVLIYGIVYFSIGVVIGLVFLPSDPILPLLLIILYFNILFRLYRTRLI